MLRNDGAGPAPEEIAQFRADDRNGMPVLSISGEIDLSNADALRQALAGVSHDGAAAIDMTEVTYIDSTGLNAIAQYGRAQLEAGNELFLVITRAPLRKIFEITNFDKYFTMLSSLGDLP